MDLKSTLIILSVLFLFLALEGPFCPFAHGSPQLQTSESQPDPGMVHTVKCINEEKDIVVRVFQDVWNRLQVYSKTFKPTPITQIEIERGGFHQRTFLTTKRGPFPYRSPKKEKEATYTSFYLSSASRFILFDQEQPRKGKLINPKNLFDEAPKRSVPLSCQQEENQPRDDPGFFDKPRSNSKYIFIDRRLPLTWQKIFFSDLKFLNRIKGTQGSALHKQFFKRSRIKGSTYMSFFLDIIHFVRFVDIPQVPFAAFHNSEIFQHTMWVAPLFLSKKMKRPFRITTYLHEAYHAWDFQGEALTSTTHVCCPSPFQDERGEDRRALYSQMLLAGHFACDENHLGAYGLTAVMAGNLLWKGRKNLFNSDDRRVLEKVVIDCQERILDPASKDLLKQDIRSIQPTYPNQAL
jgi:hypothetical protein